MKTSLLSLVLATLAMSPAFAQQKVGVVDFLVIKQKYAKAQDNEKRLGSAVEGVKADLAARGEKLKKLQSEAESANKDAENPTLAEAARTAKKTEAKQKIEEFLKSRDEAMRVDQQAGMSLRQRAQQFEAEIIKEVSEQSQAVAKEKGLDLVLAKGGTLYSAPALDISEDVVQRLNKAYAANPVNPETPVSAEAPKPAGPAKK